MNDLLPCPFCGTAPAWCGDVPAEEAHACHQVRCFGCGLQINSNTIDGDTVEAMRSDMAKAWNRRDRTFLENATLLVTKLDHAAAATHAAYEQLAARRGLETEQSLNLLRAYELIYRELLAEERANEETEAAAEAAEQSGAAPKTGSEG